METNKKIIYIVGGVVVLAVILIILYFMGIISPGLVKKVTFQKTPQVIEENLVIPDTQKVTGSDGRVVEKGNVETPLVPKDDGEKIIVAKAILTVKGSYDLAMPEAQKWSLDAKVAMIKSLGAVTLEGKSSQWQLAFTSKSKPKKGYEIIIQADKIVSQKEIDSTAVGADLPASFKDSAEAIKVLQELPQYSDASLSAVSLYYNTDGKIWRYTLSTSKGSVSTSAQ
jgi:hypothetical protein